MTATATDTNRVQRKFRWIKLFKPAVFIVCLLPVVAAVAGVANNSVGPNPVEALLHSSGEWGLRFLLLTLSVTPLQMIFKWGTIAKFRRMFGLYAFFYALLHLTIWIVLDQGADYAAAFSEIVEKKYITVGIFVVLGMLPLAVTSNRWAIRRLGVRWKSLHRLIYPLSVLAILHFLWQVRANDVMEPAAYLVFLTVLLIWRFARVAGK
ncbi:hypothetical protein AB833_06425 [Chromatiales bacterium (ex Bugula neritina AB1)]|nr:hypothetical protein AB833_06425 [Chromatiales bacterium (ex Bugula neritina AB1)]